MKPHLAMYKKAELFGQFYDEVFLNLNAAQMVLAVLIFRYCDSMRHQTSKSKDIASQRSYSHYLLASLIGKHLLSSQHLSLKDVTHSNFVNIRQYWELNKESLYAASEKELNERLKTYFIKPLKLVDGRSIAAAFRRFEFVNIVLADPM
jgi:hypothetical protein